MIILCIKNLPIVGQNTDTVTKYVYFAEARDPFHLSPRKVKKLDGDPSCEFGLMK